MLRELQTTTGKVYDTMNTIADDAVVGMGVVKDYEKANEVKFPGTATDKGVFFVTKEKRTLGVNAGREGFMSDYDDEFMNIKAGEGVKLVAPVKSERYATDQVAAAIDAGKYVELGTDGKWAEASGTTRFVSRGTKKVDTHDLTVIEVVD